MQVSGSQEFHLPLRNLGQENSTAVQKFVADLSPDLKVPRDQLAFYTVSTLEQVLKGVREIVLSLLSAARRQITG